MAIIVRQSTITIGKLAAAINGLIEVEKDVEKNSEEYVSRSKIQGFINRIEPFIIDYARVSKKYNKLKKRPKAVDVKDIKLFLEYAIDELDSLRQTLESENGAP